MGLYAVLNESGNPIAYHENKRVTKEFLKEINKKNYIAVKVKHPKDVEDTEEYAELYLVKVGTQYIQSKYFDSVDILNQEEVYSYDSLVNIITRELEYNEDITNSERKSLQKTLLYFQRRIKEIKDNPCDYETAKRFYEMREEMEYSCHDDVNDYEKFY